MARHLPSRQPTGGQMRRHRHTPASFLMLVLVSVEIFIPAAFGQALGSLKRVTVPQPANLGQYVRDPTALVVLGKSLFWDMQVSSDGRVACASCHFHAGADHRVQNHFSNPFAACPANYLLTSAGSPH